MRIDGVKFWSVACFLVNLGCSGDPSQEKTESTAFGITDGTPVPQDEIDGALSRGVVILPDPMRCTGTLLTPDWVLTARHCSCAPPGDACDPALLAGATARLGGETRNVVEMRLFSPSVDVALLRLSAPIPRLTPAGIPRAIDNYPWFGRTVDLLNREMTCFGYGRNDSSTGGNIPFGTLHSGNFRVTDVSFAPAGLSFAGVLQNGLQPAIAGGDSGSPCFVQEGPHRFIVSVTSQRSAPNAVSVEAFRDWAEGVVGPNRLAPDIRVDDIPTGGASDLGQESITNRSAPRTFTIRNNGTTTLSGLRIQLTGTNRTEFQIWKHPDTAIAPGAATTFALKFAPETLGTKAARVTVFSNDPDTGSYIVNLSGTAIPVTGPNLLLSAYGYRREADGGMDFGSVFPGDSIDLEFTIENNGTATLNLSSVRFLGGQNAFYAYPPRASSLAPGAKTTFAVVFFSSGGDVADTLKIVSNDSNPTNYLLHVTGTSFD